MMPEDLPRTIAGDRSRLADLLRGAGDAVPAKTYLVEVREQPAPDGDSPGDADPLLPLRLRLADADVRERYVARLRTGAKSGLAVAAGNWDGDEEATILVDFSDPRYWMLHTLARSEAADWIVAKLAAPGTAVSRVALPGQILARLAAMGALCGLRLGHDRRVFGGADADPAGTDHLSMQLWGEQSGRVLELLGADPVLNDFTTLSRVRVRYAPEDAGPEGYCVADIRSDGRIVAQGFVLGAHLDLALAAKRWYAAQVDRIESRFALRPDTERGVLSAHCLAIRMSRPIDDLARFCEIAFSAARPFRLWGVPAKASASLVRARAFDQRDGARLDLEVAPDFIRVSLPRPAPRVGSGGGAVMRLYACLQQHLDSRVRLVDQDDNDVLES